MRNVFGGLSFNLSRVAAEGAPGTASRDCCNHSGGRRGNLNLAHTRMCNISSTAQHPAAVCRGVLQLTVALSPQHLFGVPGRKHASCSTVTFDSLRSETAHQRPYYVLKKDPPSIPKSKGGGVVVVGGESKRRCLEIDSCYCAVPSGTFAREQKRVNIL